MRGSALQGPSSSLVQPVCRPCTLRALCRALSHPNIVQAYTCLTDVAVRDLLAACFRAAPPSVLPSSAYKYLAGAHGQGLSMVIECLRPLACTRGAAARPFCTPPPIPGEVRQAVFREGAARRSALCGAAPAAKHGRVSLTWWVAQAWRSGHATSRCSSTATWAT